MDFNLSSICNMLGDRIEEYKTTSKKRRIQRDSCAPKPKIAKMTYDQRTKNSIKKQNGFCMYASTPVGTPKTATKQFSTSSATFSSITKLPQPTVVRTLSRNFNVQARKLTFDDADDTADMDEKSETEKSLVSFASITKVNSIETLKIRRLTRAKVNVRRLFAEEDDQTNSDCLSKHSAIIDTAECSIKGPFAEDKEKCVECLSEDITRDSNMRHETPLYTPKRQRLSRRSMNAKRLTFDTENEDMRYNNSSPFQDKLGEIQSNNLHLVKCLLSDAETTMTQNESMSTLMVLNVGICIQPIRHGRLDN